MYQLIPSLLCIHTLCKYLHLGSENCTGTGLMGKAYIQNLMLCSEGDCTLYTQALSSSTTYTVCAKRSGFSGSSSAVGDREGTHRLA